MWHVYFYVSTISIAFGTRNTLTHRWMQSPNRPDLRWTRPKLSYKVVSFAITSIGPKSTKIENYVKQLDPNQIKMSFDLKHDLIWTILTWTKGSVFQVGIHASVTSVVGECWHMWSFLWVSAEIRGLCWSVYHNPPWWICSTWARLLWFIVMMLMSLYVSRASILEVIARFSSSSCVERGSFDRLVSSFPPTWAFTLLCFRFHSPTFGSFLPPPPPGWFLVVKRGQIIEFLKLCCLQFSFTLCCLLLCLCYG